MQIFKNNDGKHEMGSKDKGKLAKGIEGREIRRKIVCVHLAIGLFLMHRFSDLKNRIE
jgi:hypothetical protein